MKKILIINGLLPLQNPFVLSSFIRNRIIQFEKNQREVRLISFDIRDNWIIYVIKQLMKKKSDYHRPFFPSIVEDKINWTFINVRRTISDLFFTDRVYWRLVQSSNVDFHEFNHVIVHFAFQSGMIGYVLKKKLKIPYSLILHGSDVHSLPYLSKRNRKELLLSLEYAEKCLFVSHNLLEKAKTLGYSGNNAYVNHNGYNPKIFNFVDKDEAKKGKSIPTKFLVGFVGNLIPVKNVLILPQIFKQILQEIEDVSFVIIGSGSLVDQLQQLCEFFNEKVIFPGQLPINAVAEYMKAMDILLLPSLNEGYPCVVNEAQACGTYVIASDAGGIPEAVGDAGSVFPLDDKLTENMGKECLRIFRESYDLGKVIRHTESLTWENVAKKELEIIESVIK